MNFPRTSCTYDAARDCAGGRCVVGAIERQLGILASAASDEARLQALKYVVHFVGDVHQPLHAGFADDRGGNQYQLQAFGKGTNIHQLWDSGLLDSRNEDTASALNRLKRVNVDGEPQRGSVVSAAQESCAIASRPDFYPPRKLSDEYVARFMPVMDLQLALAGAQLAELLNEAFR